MGIIKYNNNTKSIATGFIAALIAAALFGSVSTIAKPVLYKINPFLLSSLVYLISSIPFSLMVLLRNNTPSSSSSLLPLQTESSSSKRSCYTYIILITTSIIGAAIAPAMFFFGLRQTTASDTSLLANGETIFSIILAILFFKEKLTPLGYLAALIVLGGLVVVTTNLQVHSSLLKMNFGNVLVLGATALWGLDNNICRIIITDRMDIARLVQLKSLIGGAVLFTFAAFVFHIPLLSIGVIGAGLPQIVLLGVVGFGTSLYLFLISMQRIGIIKSTLVLTFSSVFGLAFASLLLGEVISTYQIIAIVVMIIGIYLINMEKKKETDRIKTQI
ncbi:MAG: DMT family transporter [Nitrososphaeraceae archaeon]|nr:DMT family transporter [Nitrososphaeraceae archaeon]